MLWRIVMGRGFLERSRDDAADLPSAVNGLVN